MASRKKGNPAGAKPPQGDAKPVRVAIVGGGCAALTAAWHLAHRKGYEVHVYERSWRLGGKGASGRDADGRIREHGLHIWLGFYENAFRLMRECYREAADNGWGPQADEGKRLAHASLQDAFFPEQHIGVAVRDVREAAPGQVGWHWSIWSGMLPPAPGMPGEPLDAETNPFTVPSYLLRCYQLLRTLMVSVIGPGDELSQPRDQRTALDGDIELGYAYNPRRTQKEIVAWSARVLRGAALTAASLLLQAVLVMEKLMETPASAPPIANLRTFQLVTAILEQTRRLLVDVSTLDPVLRRKLDVIDIVIAIAVGLYRNRLLFGRKGFDTINRWDYREWLLKQGANPAAVESRFLTGIYDLTFAYEDGERPQIAAGVALRGALRMFFTYRGSMFWRMRSGMGDAVFAPLYRVLLARGVKFHFRHALDDVEMERIGEQPYVKALHFRTVGRAADLDAQAANALDHFGCWPDDAGHFVPHAGKAAGRVSLQRGKQFEAVILATGADDFVAIGDRARLFEALPEHWKKMRDNIRTVATQSAQVWLSEDLEQLGWLRGSGIMTGMGEPFETWADMTHTLATEKAWRAARGGLAPSPHDGARSVAYFCGVVPEDAAPSQEAAQKKARSDFELWLAQGMKPFWPGAFDAAGKLRPLRVGNEHVQANATGSDRYTLSLPKTIAQRISPLDRSVPNMTIAGDWTASGLDAGCVEGAVMSGMLAAYAICGDEDLLDSIVGYDHP